MKRRYELAEIYPFEYHLLEEHLNEMAKQGWQIDRMRGRYLRYHQEIKEHHYEVTLIKNYHRDDPAIEDENIRKLQDFMEEFHYHPICSFGPFQILESGQPQSLSTDVMVESQNIQEITKKYPKPFSGIYVFLFIMLCFLLPVLSFDPSSQFHFLSSYSAMFSVPACAILIACVWFLRIPYRKFRKQGIIASHPFSFQRKVVSILPWIIITLIFVFSPLYLFFGCMILIAFAQRMLARNFPKYEQFFAVCGIIGYTICYFYVPKPSQTPAYSLPIVYDEYQSHSSAFASYERYFADDEEGIKQMVLAHYSAHSSLARSLLASILQEDTGNSSLPDHPVSNGSLSVFPINEEEVWIFYTPCSQAQLEDLDQIFRSI